MRLSALLVLAAALVSLVHVHAATYNVREFGATGDGATKDTVAFQGALDTCAVNGGGDVVVPAGRYLIGSVQLGDCTFLRLEKESVIVGSPDLADYPLIDIRWEGRMQPGRRALIHAANVHHTGTPAPDTSKATPRSRRRRIRAASSCSNG